MARDALSRPPSPGLGGTGGGSRLELGSRLHRPSFPASLPSEPRPPTSDLDLDLDLQRGGERAGRGAGPCLQRVRVWGKARRVPPCDLGASVSPWFSPHNSIAFEVEEPSRDACVEPQTWKASLSRGSCGQQETPHSPQQHALTLARSHRLKHTVDSYVLSSVMEWAGAVCWRRMEVMR